MSVLRGGLAVSSRDRRALTLGVVGIVSAVVLVRGIPALRQWSEASVASAREVSQEATRAVASVRAAGTLKDTMRARGERFIALAPVILDGSSTATAGATLGSIVSGAAAAADAKLGSIQVLPEAARRDSSGRIPRAFARVSVRASMTADIRGLSKVLLALERGPTMLSVEELSVTQPEPAGDGSRPEMLQVELVVAGLAHLRPERSP